jgi:hypothetical protein
MKRSQDTALTINILGLLFPKESPASMFILAGSAPRHSKFTTLNLLVYGLNRSLRKVALS